MAPAAIMPASSPTIRPEPERSRLTKIGAGSITLSGANTFSGATSVNSGQLLLSSTGSLGNTAISVAQGATLGVAPGSGTINVGTAGVGNGGAALALASGANFSMQDGSVGSFNLRQQSGFSVPSLALSGASLNFDMSGSSTDVLNAQGAASVTGNNTINLVAASSASSLSLSPRNLITAASGLGAGGQFAFANGTSSEQFQVGNNNYTLSLNRSATALSLNVAGGNDFWIGGSPGNASGWDTAGTLNFSSSSGGPRNIVFNTGDSLAFDDNAASFNVNVDSTAANVSPASLTFNNANHSYMVADTSTGVIGGSGALAIQGGGSVSISGPNTFSGGTTVSNGTLVLNSSTVGSGPITSGPIGAGSLSISSGGEVDLQGGITIGNTLSSLVGTGIGNGAALYNLAGNNSYSGAITLANPATIGAASNTTLTLSGGIDNGGNLLTLGGDGNINATTSAIGGAGGLTIAVGPNSTVTLSAAETYAGPTSVNSGTLVVDSTGSLANSTNLNVAAGAAFKVNAGGSIPLSTALTNNGAVTLSNPTTTIATLNGTSAAAALDGNALTITSGGTYAGGITGAGSLNVSGGTLTLSGSNSYSGSTTVAAGATLALANSASSNNIANSSGVSLGAGATLDVTGSSSQTFMLGASNVQSLSGPVSGTASVLGNLTVGSLGTLNISGGMLTIGGAGGGVLNLAAGSTTNLALPPVGQSGPLITANALVLPSSGSAGIGISNASALPSGIYDLIDTTAGITNANAILFGSNPHNWSLSTTTTTRANSISSSRSPTVR